MAQFSAQLLLMRLKIHNTEVVISYTLICLAALCIFTGIFEGFVWCLIAVIIHETGHLIPMSIFGGLPDRIKISLFEISISDSRRQSRTTVQNVTIIFSGPFANFICFILFYLLYLFCNKNFVSLAAVNLFTGLFNMLPVLSLDGGQLLYILLCRRLDSRKAQRVVNIVTFIFIFPLAAAGFLLLFSTQYNFSLLAVSVYLVLSLILKRDTFYTNT